MESLDDIFLNARQIADPAGQAAYLAQACGADAELRARVEAMLRDAEGAEEFFGADGTLACGAGSPQMEAEFARLKPEEAGDRIGNFKLLEQIGQGGFGTVWVAEQERPVRRRVALKIIKLGMDTKEVIARFEQERQALAMMDHPNIAKVFDAGASETGRPYFVMELVRGIKITEYCDQANLSTAGRLELFVAVCQAVQHAHQKGIIHRDLKPSNILVTLHDGVPVPKVIDFGVAKATQQQRLTDLTVYTQFEQMVGTPLYMSPEQAEMSGLDVDTRSDIYSLGVLLYELLTGRTPFDPETLMRQGLDEIRRAIREQEPQKPSTFVQTLPFESRATVARHRQAEAAKLAGLIRGDLDWIVMKAIEKDRNRRYETASGFAKDIERHLAHEPVQARPPSRAYQFRKLVRRNKLAVAATAAVAVALVIGLGAATWMFFKERAALSNEKIARGRAETAEKIQSQLRATAEANERKAETEAARSAQVAQFMKDMLEGVGPSVALGRNTDLLREILDKTAERIGVDLKNQPMVEAELRSTLGLIYIELGEFVRGEQMAREALRIRRAALDERDPLVAASMAQLAAALSKRNQPKDTEEAEALITETVTRHRELGREENAEFAGWVALRAGVLNRLGKREEAETVSREALALRRKILGAEHPHVAGSLDNLALVLRDSGKLDEAERCVREALAIQQKVIGKDSVEASVSLQYLGGILQRQKKYAEAEAAFREALDVNRKIRRGDNLYTVTILSDLAAVLRAQSKHAEAISFYRQVVAARKKLHGDPHRHVSTALINLARSLQAEGKLAEAEVVFREELAMERKLSGDEHPFVANSLHELAQVLAKEMRHAEAEPLFREALTIRKKRLGAEHRDTTNTMHRLGVTLEFQRNHTESEQMFREVLALRKRAQGPDYPSVVIDLTWLGRSLFGQGKHADAETHLREALSFSRKTGLDARIAAFDWLASVLEAQEKWSDVHALVREEIKRVREATDNGSAPPGPALGLALHHAAIALGNAKALKEARALAEEAWTLYEQHPDWPEVEREHALIVFAAVLRELGGQAAFESIQRKMIDRLRSKGPAEERQLAGALADLTLHLLTQQEFSKAEASARESLAIREKVAPDDWRTFNSRSMLGGGLLGQKKYADAEPLLLSGYEGMKQRENSIPPTGRVRLREALQRLMELCEATARPDQAAEWKKKLEAFNTGEAERKAAAAAKAAAK